MTQKKSYLFLANPSAMGMLPNRFQDDKQPPEYNNADGTLWYFNAVYEYLKITNDRNFILNEVLPVLKDIIAWHFKGTRYNIHVDRDGLYYMQARLVSSLPGWTRVSEIGLSRREWGSPLKSKRFGTML